MNKQKFLGVFMLLIAAFFISGEASAENGKLTINNQVIYEKNKEKEDSIEYLIAPDLFLEHKTAINQQNLAAHEKISQQAKEQVFVAKQLPQTGQAQKVYVKKLFLENYEGAAAHSNQGIQQSGIISKGLIYFFAAVAVVGMLVLGILLGRRFSTVFVRKK
ncbi:type VII secretion protein EssA [Enterococcus sp. DIV0187]|uniref:type VII secretion protein EssA n=1 Tax=Enterococcus sp. DIV0187 TaxID=2774644 RepID=UPI003F27B878